MSTARWFFTAILLGWLFNFLMGSTWVMDLMLYAGGVAGLYYVVVESAHRYRLMKELTEGPDLAPPT